MWKKIGVESVVNATTSGVQAECAAAALDDGSFVLVWTDSSQTGQDRSGTAIRAQLYAADGTKSGGEFLVNVSTQGNQSSPAVAPLAGGRFAVTWSDSTSLPGAPGGIRTRVFAASGNSISAETLVKGLSSVAAYGSAVTGLPGGAFLVTWDDNGSGALANTASTIRGQIFNADGTRRGAEFPVSTAASGNQLRSSSTALAGGGFVVTWTDNSQAAGDTSGPAIRGQIFDVTGARIGAAFLVNTTTAGNQDWSSVAALEDGRFVATWGDESSSADDPSFSAVRGRVFARDGRKIGAEFLVNTTTAGVQGGAAVAALGDGRFVVTWADSGMPASGTGAIRGQIFAADGSRSGPEFTVNASLPFPVAATRVIALGSGRFAVAWTQAESASGINADVHMQVVDAKVFEGTAAGETVKGGNLADRLTGTGGNDRLDGSDGMDTAVYSGRRSDYIIRGGTASGEILVTDCRPGSPDGTDTLLNVEVFAFSDGEVKQSAILNAGPVGLAFVADARPLFENSPAGSVVGSLAATDPDPGADLRYSLLDDAGGRFLVDAKSGQLTVRPGASLDFETTPTLSLRVRVSDRGILALDRSFAIALANVSGSVAGTAGPDSLAGTGEEDTIQGLVGNDTIRGGAGNDTIDGGGGTDLVVYSGRRSDYLVRQDTGTGAIVLTDLRAGSPDGTDRVVNVESFSFADSSFSAAAVINNPPSGIELTGGTLPENSPSGTPVGQLQAIDPDGTAGLVYSLLDNAGGRFAVNAQTGWVTVRSGAVLDYEAGPTVLLTARVTDKGGLAFDRTFTIRLSDVNEAPSNLLLDGGRVAENAAAGTVVGTLRGSDPDAGSVLTYNLVNDAGGRFAVDPVTGRLTVRPGAVLDFEKTPTLSIRARVSDATGLALEKVFTVALDNVAGSAAGTALADLLSGTTEEDVLRGFDGADTLLGLAGNDTLDGGAGNDLLVGGAGSDNFVFKGPVGKDTITDFAASGTAHDTLQIDVGLVGTWADLLARTSQAGSDLVITLSPTDSITLKNVSAAAFTAEDVRFST